jgi:alkylated DNA repair protein (DNA oxidative demethylase)
MTFDLFSEDQLPALPSEQIGERAFVLRGYASPYVAEILPALDAVLAVAPWRHLVTPGGLRMSVAMSNCGAFGWTSDLAGYRYTATDPETGRAWPELPAVFLRLAVEAAAAAGFEGFRPDACLINRYDPGTRLSLHQDKDERDLGAPIVSVSLGLDATFLFGGLERSDKTARIGLRHGDVVVWGGPDRLRFHGILPVKPGRHPLTGEHRINLTFRKSAR